MSMFSSMNNVRGSALVEFALILPILLVLAFGITEFGRALYQQNILGKSIEAGTRYLARGYNAVTDDCAPGPNWSAGITAATNLVVHGNEAGSGGLLLPRLSTDGVEFGVEARSLPEIGTTCVVTGRAVSEFNAVFGDSVVPFLDVGVIHLGANSEERYIGD